MTNADGNSSVAYAPVSITGGVAPPTITASTPAEQLPLPLSVGQTQPFSVTTQDAAGHAVSVQWTVNGASAGSGASFSYTPGAADAGTRVVQATASDATDAAAGTASQSWLVAVCPVPGPPGQPTGVTATAGDAKATITWSAPAGGCGNAVTGYVVVASTGQAATLPATATGVNFLGLTNGTPVSFTVTAVNAIGAGQPSAASPTVTPGGTTTPPPPGNLTLTQIGTTKFPSPIGIDWYEPANQVVMSVNYGGGNPNNFDLVDANGNFTPFSSVKGVGDEVYLTAIQTSSCEAGFTPGDIYFGTNSGGVIARITSNGTVVQSPWVTLPGETSTLRGGLFQDVNCVAGGDLIVTTESGDVWRVTAAGVATKVKGGFGASWLEGPTTVPNDPTRYGPWAGKIIATDESNGAIWSIDPASGAAAKWTGGTGNPWVSAEGVRIIPPNENFFGVDYGSGHLEGLPASDFNSMVGDVLLWTESYGRLIDIKWDAATQTFVSQNLLKTNAAQWEGATFAGAGLPGVTSTTGLSCIASTSTAQLGTLVKLTGQLVNVANPAGIPISFVDSGANSQSVTVAADASGIATFNLAGSTAGSEAVVLTATVGGQTLTSNPCDVTWQGTPPGVITYTGPTSGDFGDSVSLSAHLVDGSGGAISGASVAFTLGTQACTGTTGGTGDASCAISIDQPVGPVTVTATYTQPGGWYATVSTGFTITPEETVLTYTGPAALDTHDPGTVSATLTSDDSVPIANQAVSFTLNGAETCSGTTAADGSVSCSLTPQEPAASYSLAISFAGNPPYQPTSTTPSLNVQLEQTTTTVVSAQRAKPLHAVVLARLLQDGDPTLPLVGQTVAITATPTGGGTPVTGSGTVGLDGVAAVALPLAGGTYSVQAAFAGTSVFAGSADTGPLTIQSQDATKLTYTGATSGDFNDAVTVSAALTDTTVSPAAPVSGKSISFTLGSGAGTPTCTGITDNTGTASCALTPTQPAGPLTVSASFAGDASYLASNTSTTFTVALEQATLVITSSNTLPAGNVTVSAQLREDGTATAPLAGRSVTFTATPNGGGQTVTGNGTTGGTGTATTSLTLPPGDYTLAAHFAGDTFYQPADAASLAHLYVYQPSQFVIWGGNPPGTAAQPNVTVGTDYTFWGAQWAKQVTGGSYSGTNSFKGYAATVSGTSWSTRPGNASNPPAAVPSYIGVIVSTSVTKSGSTISGNVAEVVVLQVDNSGAYQPNPGHPGTGVLVAVVP